jgi:hypothetical protein
MKIIKEICLKYLLEVIMRISTPGNALCTELSACLKLVATSTNICGSLLLRTLRNTIFAKLGSYWQECKIRNILFTNVEQGSPMFVILRPVEALWMFQ